MIYYWQLAGIQLRQTDINTTTIGQTKIGQTQEDETQKGSSITTSNLVKRARNRTKSRLNNLNIENIDRLQNDKEIETLIEEAERIGNTTGKLQALRNRQKERDEF